MAINRFIGEWEEFSNFYPATIFYEGLKFPSVEHAYVASKSLDMSFRRDIALMKAEDSGLAKKWGRNVKLRPNWNTRKVDFMRNFLRQKFGIHYFQEKLLSTKERELIEGNFWHDNFWGNCGCGKCKEIKGTNMLGKLLMEIREVIKNENSSSG